MTYERCNPDLGPLTAKLLEQQREIARLTAERDEARRMTCLFQSRLLGSEPLWWATKQGWDCFKEDGK